MGLALAGFVPIAEIQFMGFTHNAFNQISSAAHPHPLSSWGSLSVPVTIRTPYGGGVRAPEMHSDGVRGALRALSGAEGGRPANPADARGMLLSAIRDPDPVMFLEPLRGYRLIKGEVRRRYTVPLGKAPVSPVTGTDCTVIAWSAAVEVAKQAAAAALKQGVSVEVIDLRSLVPMDTDTLRESVTKTGRVVVLQESLDDRRRRRRGHHDDPRRR